MQTYLHAIDAVDTAIPSFESHSPRDLKQFQTELPNSEINMATYSKKKYTRIRRELRYALG
jgi:hypothetical protein